MADKRTPNDALADVVSILVDQTRRLGETLEQSNQRLSDRIDQMNTSLTHRIDDLAVQISNQSQSIGRLEKAISDLAEDSRSQHEIAQLQAQNVAELIKTVQQLAIARG